MGLSYFNGVFCSSLIALLLKLQYFIDALPTQVVEVNQMAGLLQSYRHRECTPLSVCVPTLLSLLYRSNTIINMPLKPSLMPRKCVCVRVCVCVCGWVDVCVFRLCGRM